MEYRKNEIRAGAFILISFLILVGLLFSVSDLQGMFKKRKEYKVLFQANEGLEKHANVRISGIRVGRVSNMRIVPELGNKVELTLDVFEDAVIMEDVKVSIKTQGVVGKKYVDISGGTPNARPLKPGAVLYGEESLKMEDLTRMAMDAVNRLKGVALSIEKVVQNVERTVGDPALAKNIKGAVANVNDITENVKVMTSSKDEVAKTLKELPELMKKVDASIANLKEITEKTDKLIGENRKNIDDTLANVKEISANVKDVSEKMKKDPWILIRKP
jgi:phospholipid/cholesterol/gamma-HCH transport system substrate-binding protein